MSIHIVGCGDLGTATGLRFAADGHRVVGFRRHPDRIPLPLEGRGVDLRTTVPVIDPDVEVVVVALAAGSREPAEYRATYVDGLRNVLDGVDASGASPRIIVVSSTAVYGVDDGSTVTEATPATGPTPTAAVLVEAETLLRDRVPDATVLRLSGVYGPGRERLIDQVRSGAARLTAAPGRSPVTNRIHRDDAAAAIVHITGLVDPAPLYLGTDDEPVRLDDVSRFIATELGLPEPPTADRSPAADGSTSATSDTSDQRSDKSLSNALLRSTGFAFRYPTYREGYRAVIAGTGVRHP
ncbi:NAD-dependent epimerase/dehydratase family protein [Curtobacterium sp. Leaf261]|uniref:NAD-dependent epimerase/dehydratase family protein n=1 Tax=Curtobacterium sp. Leaf261 TaxID=1736311 RepID=UPI0006F981F2|nr:NAD-dependent epimerase/dehydratase family protein [Curtobacterium sp. Leaf261]KQO63693.1 NAD(P)-dependent oxidoreductase [Curtobacterium sp. Leaf261]